MKTLKQNHKSVIKINGAAAKTQGPKDVAAEQYYAVYPKPPLYVSKSK